MDEPSSALDPISTGPIEELMLELNRNYSIVIVTHNMQQAARVSDRTAFFDVDTVQEGRRVGRLVEFARHEPPIDSDILCKILQMGRFARSEVIQCKRSFAERDVPMAEDLVARDVAINRLNREIFRLALDAGADADVRGR